MNVIQYSEARAELCFIFSVKTRLGESLAMPGIKSHRAPMTRINRVNEHLQENVPSSFQSVLRLRPLSKKEREEHTILEPTSARTVVLHPLPSRSDRLSPSSSLVLQTLDTDQIHIGHDVEFSFDTVFPPDASQEKVYFSLGHSMAQSSMEPLKSPAPETAPLKTNLLVAMGLVESGKSYSCWGDGVVSKRKAIGDGLVPRVIDSLFSQSKHHVSRKPGHSFAVNFSFLQIDQSQNKPSESKIHDLLQPVARNIMMDLHVGLCSPVQSLKSPNTTSRT
jgi:hypothetical protein